MRRLPPQAAKEALKALGWSVGDACVSLIDHGSINLKVGDEGKVLGPCNNASLADASERVSVDFGSGKGKLNMLAKTIVTPAEYQRREEEVRVFPCTRPPLVGLGQETLFGGGACALPPGPKQ